MGNWRCIGCLCLDEGLWGELGRVYAGGCLGLYAGAVCSPPRRYYFRVNRLRVDPGMVLDEMRAEGLRVYRDEFLEEALWMPVEGPFRVPGDAACRVFVDKYTAESVMLGADVYAPGVVGVDGDCRPGGEAVVVHEGFVAGFGRLSGCFEEALRRGRGVIVVVEASRYRVPSLRGTRWFREGLVYEQSLPGMVASRILGPEPGSLVVDMCAAPGGKTGHLYELCGGRCRVYAFDHSRRRVGRLRETLERLGHRGVVVYRADSRYLDVDYPELLGRVDYVMLDPPCSALGVMPKLYDRKRLGDVEALAEYQRQFLKVAWRLLRPGGVLVYSTCTVTALENEDNIRWAVEELGFVVEDAWWPGASRGLLPGTLRYHPHVQGVTGYFIARLRKPLGV